MSAKGSSKQNKADHFAVKPEPIFPVTCSTRQIVRRPTIVISGTIGDAIKNLDLLNKHLGSILLKTRHEMAGSEIVRALRIEIGEFCRVAAT